MKKLQLTLAFTLIGMTIGFAPPVAAPDASSSGLLLGLGLLGLMGARRLLRK